MACPRGSSRPHRRPGSSCMSFLEAVEGWCWDAHCWESTGPVSGFGESLVSGRQNILRLSQKIQDRWLSCKNTINRKTNSRKRLGSSSVTLNATLNLLGFHVLTTSVEGCEVPSSSYTLPCCRWYTLWYTPWCCHWHRRKPSLFFITVCEKLTNIFEASLSIRKFKLGEAIMSNEKKKDRGFGHSLNA